MTNSNILYIDSCKTAIDDAKTALLKVEVQSNLYFSESYADAWQMLSGENTLTPAPKIVLIAINEIGSEGIELIKKIRKDANLRSLLIFVITSVHDDKNKVAALDLNIAGYFDKPFENHKISEFYTIMNDYWNIIEF
ncbi:response regulator [Flavobacterium hiemivividum]|uniref:Response regulator n=1 Tax=Flavobacterium hiemivividum TaxID=2541734 RepID=A0A4R5CPS8_9FLAO|nr:response regulator [Flavobacterium hiemivividum]TDE01417.1 response regulator [Flavobacterium hiemivividum]